MNFLFVCIAGIFPFILFQTAAAESGFSFITEGVTLREGSLVEIDGTFETEFKDTDIEIEIKDSRGNVIDIIPKKTDFAGTVEVKFTLPENVQVGDIQITIKDKRNLAFSVTQELNIIIPNIDKTISDLKLKCSTEDIINGKCFKTFNESAGGCLIATAAYGTELSPEVQNLRDIRNKMYATELGGDLMKSINDFYYSFSPTVADWERENQVFREIVKIAITPSMVSFTILDHNSIESEIELVGYVISIVLLNIGMYFVVPALIVFKIKPKIS